MKLDVIDNHSVAMDLIRPCGWVLDAGCRGLAFANEVRSRAKVKVLALDPGRDITQEWGFDLFVLQLGLVGAGQSSFWTLEHEQDPQATRLGKPISIAEFSYNHLKAGSACAQSLDFFMEKFDIDIWEAVKLNIEGSEYDVLTSLAGPIARQISVSFHEHTDRRRGDAAIQAIVDHLSQWYVSVQHQKDARYCAGENFWDSLFVLKELV